MRCRLYHNVVLTHNVIMKLVINCSFTLITYNGKRSRLRRLKKGVPGGSVLAPLLFNIYICDLPITVSRECQQSYISTTR